MSKRIDINRIKDNLFRYVGIGCTLFGLLMLGFFLYSVLREGLPRLNAQFFSSLPSRKPEEAGILIPLFGTIWVMVLTSLISIPLGVCRSTKILLWHALLMLDQRPMFSGRMRRPGCR